MEITHTQVSELELAGVKEKFCKGITDGSISHYVTLSAYISLMTDWKYTYPDNKHRLKRCNQWCYGKEG
jgi:hypothetical protein